MLDLLPNALPSEKDREKSGERASERQWDRTKRKITKFSGGSPDGGREGEGDILAKLKSAENAAQQTARTTNELMSEKGMPLKLRAEQKIKKKAHTLEITGGYKL